MSETREEDKVVGAGSERRNPPVIHKVMPEMEKYPVHPALCGFIFRPSNACSLPQAIIEKARECEECLTISLELDLALD